MTYLVLGLVVLLIGLVIENVCWEARRPARKGCAGQ